MSEMTAELTGVLETKQQLEMDYVIKCEALQSLSTEFQAAKTSFEVSCRFISSS